MLTREQIIQNIEALERQGASQQEIQGYIDSLSGGFKLGDRFNVPTRKEAEISDAQRQSQQFGETLSPWGTVKRYASEVGKALTPGTLGVGEAIFQSFDQGKTAQELVDIQSQGLESLTELYKRIIEIESNGGDATRLKQVYNEQLRDIERLNPDISKYINVRSSGEFLGNVGSMSLDLLTAGTYGAATKGTSPIIGKTLDMTATPAMKSFQLGKAAPTAVPLIAGPLRKGMTAAQRFKASLPTTALGASIGYGYDVAEGFAGRRGEEVNPLAPGLGTAFGTSLGALPLLGVVGGKVGSLLTKGGRATRSIEKRREALIGLEQTNATVRNAFDDARRSGIDPIEVLSQFEYLNNSVSKDGRIDTTNALGLIDEEVKPVEDFIKRVIDSEKATIKVKDFRAKMVQALQDTQLQGSERIAFRNALEKELKGFLETSKRGNIDLGRVQTAKIDRQSGRNYADPIKDRVQKEVARVFKEMIEETLTSVDVRTFNAQLAKSYALRGVLKKLNGKVVKGGRLGKYFAGTVGAVVGGKIGGGLGAIAGGELAMQIQRLQMISALGGKIPARVKKDPDMVKAMGIYADLFGIKPEFVQESRKATQRIPINANPNTANIATPNTTNQPKAQGLFQRIKEGLSSERGSISSGDSQYDKFADFRAGQKARGQQAGERQGVSPSKGITDNLGKKIPPEKIAGKEPLLNTKKEMVLKDLQGKSHTLTAGEAIQATRLTNGNYHIIDGEEFVINKGQYENLKAQSLVDTEPDPFAPELTDTTETVLGAEAKGKRPAIQSSGQDYKSWSESTKNNRGSNYSMIVVQAPPKTGNITKDGLKISKDDGLWYIYTEDNRIFDTMRLVNEGEPGPEQYSTAFKTKEEAESFLRETTEEDIARYNRKFPDRKQDFTGGHAQADNQLFHIRVFDDMYKGEKVLFVDEFQSDWMLALRKEAERIAQKQLPGATEAEVAKRANDLLRAYKQGKQPEKYTKLPSDYKITKQSNGTYMVERQGVNLFRFSTFPTKARAVNEALKTLNEGTQFQTPWNPLLDDWVPMAVKRALEEAEARGATKIVWTNGAQQRARYSSISQQVERMTWKKNATGKELSIKVKNRDAIDLTLDNEGKILSASSHENELKGKFLNDVILSKNAKQIMKEDSGDLTGKDMAFGGTWTEALYERQIPKTMEQVTGGKAELVDMGYKLEKGDSDLRLTDEQLEELSERGIDPDMETNATVGDLVQYFGEDHLVIEDDGNGYWLIRERDVQNRFDVDSYRRDEFDSRYEEFTYAEEIPYYSSVWGEQIQKKFTDEDGVITIPGARWVNRNEQSFYLVEPGDWGSDARSGNRYKNNDNQPPKLVNANDVEAIDLDDWGFYAHEFKTYIEAKKEGTEHGLSKKKVKDIEYFIEQNAQYGDEDFINSLVNSGDLDIEDIINEDLDSRGLDTPEGVANDWSERSGEETMVVGDEAWVVDNDSKFYAPYDEDAVAELRAQNEALASGNVEGSGLMQPALTLDDVTKARIRGEKLPLNLPSGRHGEMLPVMFPLLALLIANEED